MKFLPGCHYQGYSGKSEAGAKMNDTSGQQTWENWMKGLADDSKVTIKKYCEGHPTCKDCGYWKKHIGCSFRGKSPREWESK